MDVHYIPKGGAFVLSKSRASRSFLGGVLILGVGNLLVKLIGLVFKIPLSRLLGDEGMGYFNTGYTVYSWLFLIGCTGFPVAVSMLVSEASESDGESRNPAKRILFVSLLFLFALGLVGCLALLLFASSIAAKIGNPESAATVRSIAPAVLFCSLSGGLRGYFQGKKRMEPTAVSQLLEAALKLVFGILFARRALASGYDLPSVSAAAIRGVTLGTVASFVFLLGELLFEPRDGYIKNNGRKRESDRALSRKLLLIALPITLSATATSVTGLIDLVFVMKRLLHAGYGLSEATAVFGNYTTLAVPFFNLPGILISPIATGIVPFLSSDLAKGDSENAKRRCSTALRSAVVLSLPAAIALGLFGERILSLFFVRQSAALAAPALSVLSPGIVFLSLVTVSSAILQARGKAGVALFSMLLGAIVKTFSGFYLIGTPSVGIYGAAIGTVLCYAVAATVNLVALFVLFRQPIGAGDIVRPVVPAALSFSLAYLALSFLPDRANVLSTVLLLATAGTIYVPFSILFGAISIDDVKVVPFVRKIARHSFVKNREK
ncbi:MAG: polysaccharide biosynthesis protein [Clostridia bacterium]|nr:polysaccharide biosynthesis protein [Clostridia bacterium]